MNIKLDKLLEVEPIAQIDNTNQDIMAIKNIIQESNWSFYKGIQGLMEKETDSYNKKLLEMSLAFTQKEHELHVENLERIYHNQIIKLKDEKSLEVLELESWLKQLNVKYEKLKIKSDDFETKSLSLEKINQELKENISNLSIEKFSSISLAKSKEKVLELEKIVQRLEGKNEQIEDLKNSIELSSETANALVDLANNKKLDIKLDKVNELQEKFNQLKYNPKNQTRLRKIKKQIENFKEKIESIMAQDRWSSFDKFYCKVRFVVIGVIFLSSIFIFNEPCASWIKHLSILH